MLKIFIYILYFVLMLSRSKAEEYQECENVDVGNFIAVTTNCSKAIYCNGVDSIIVECDTGSPYFSPEDEMCYNETSKCGNRPFIGGDIETTILPEATTTVGTTLRPTTLKPTTNPEATTIKLPTTPTLLPETSTTATTPGLKVTTTTSNPTTLIVATTTNDASLNITCPLTEDPNRPLFLPHPQSCSHYYMCYHGVASLMQCPNMLHFDAVHQGCTRAERANCQNSALSPREQCLAHTVDVYPHATNCNYYYQCEFGFLMVMQCPFNMGWDYEKKVCTMKSKAKCYNEVLLI